MPPERPVICAKTHVSAFLQRRLHAPLEGLKQSAALRRYRSICTVASYERYMPLHCLRLVHAFQTSAVWKFGKQFSP
jgi:hypothetical protein